MVLARGYGPIVLQDWPYIRGRDLYPHTIMTNLMLNTGSNKAWMVYPPGFHTLTAVMSRLSGLSPLQLYAALAPALMLCPVVSAAVFARRFLGPSYGVLAALFAGFALRSPALHLRAAIYVDILAAQLLLVLALLAVLLLQSPTKRNAILFVLLGSGVVLYHTITTLYLVVLLCAVSIVFLPYLLLRDPRRAMTLLAALVFLGIIALAIGFDTYDLPRTVAGLMGRTGATATTSQMAAVRGNESVFPLRTLPGYISDTAFWFGSLGVLLSLQGLRRLNALQRLPLVVLLGWLALFFVASRIPETGFIQRFVRDLGVPLSVFAAFACVTVLRSLNRSRPVMLAPAVLLALLLILQAREYTLQAARPSGLQFMTPDFAAAGEWLRQNNRGGSIIVSPHRDHTPGDAMLAMGGYTTLQAIPFKEFTSQRRNVPPRHPQQVRDVEWVVRHPEGKRTENVIRQHDVRYIVLYKRFPKGTFWQARTTIDWKSFAQHPARYAVAFANDSVIVYRVKP